MNKKLIQSMLILILAACGKPIPKLDGIDLTEWKNDRNGCGGIRQTMTDLVISQKEKLLSLSESDIISLLGKPDETELYKRNEKFYRYYFSKGPGCQQDGISKSMNLRFNSMGLMKEVVVE